MAEEPISVTITPLHLDEAIRDIENIDNFVLDDLTLTMYRAVDVIRNSILQFWPVGATGLSRQGWGTRVERGIVAVKGVVSNPVEHAIYAERGRGPGKMPPLAPIELWVRRVLGIPAPESKQVAFLVARAIGRRGTKGAHAIDKGVAAVRGIVEADFRGVPDRVAARIG
jgi:hypothetical protein